MLRGSALGNILGQDKWIADIDATNVKEVGGKKKQQGSISWMLCTTACSYEEIKHRYKYNVNAIPNSSILWNMRNALKFEKKQILDFISKEQMFVKSGKNKIPNTQKSTV